MNKVIKRFGLIGVIIVALFHIPFWLMLGSYSSFSQFNMIGTAVLAVSLIPIVLAILRLRSDQGGHLSFMKAWGTGILVGLIISLTYASLWTIISMIKPDLLDSMWNLMLDSYGAEITSEQMEKLAFDKESYQSPVIRFIWAFFEIIMYVIPVSILGALFVWKKEK